ncbi:HD domain-containing protein [Bacteroidota bacterium]
MDFESAKEYILHRLDSELDSRLVYHSYIHTVDVFKATTMLSAWEGLQEEEQRLVETAALYHDAGMLTAYENHEESSALLAADVLKTFNYTANQIETICGLIRCTRLPQLASTQLEKIICDADLDYLGRDDFFINSFRLRLEWQLHGIRTFSLSDWFLLQEEFLEQHSYFLNSAIELRNAGKHKNLKTIKELNKQHQNPIN